MLTLLPTVFAATFAFLPLSGSGESASDGKQKVSETRIADRAEFFSAEAEAEALRAIEKLQREKQIEVRVETFAAIPDGKRQNVGEMSARERAEFVAGWLKELARERQAKGVLVLICKEPSHLRVGISKELVRRGLGDQERDAISERLLRGFREQDYDRGLTDALAYLVTAADQVAPPGAAAAPADRAARRRAAPRAQEGFGVGIGGLLCVGLVGFVVVMLVMSVIRMFRRPTTMQGGYGQYGQPTPGQQGYGGQYPGQYPGYGGGYGAPAGGWGGGMFGGLMSGLGGALLGNYLYDRWNGPNTAGGQGPIDPGGAGPMSDDSTRYQDFTSSGGDFGDSAGGDFGGGDFGGGDMGGDGGGDF